ncbi:MAG: ferritin family protein [Candidatus Zixiibacteriota bacterium]|jgi:rubrerythrin
MDIFEYAMKMEQDGRDFYLENAGKTEVPAFRKILTQLADDELKHYNIFKAMKEGQKAEYKDSEQTTIIKTMKNVFDDLKAENKQLAFEPEAMAIWKEAQDVEKKSEDFYRSKAKEVGDEKQAHILNRIADEEHRHWVTMQNVIQFLNRPNSWLEDAEWNHLEDY